jgi:hypothetical protein
VESHTIPHTGAFSGEGLALEKAVVKVKAVLEAVV